MASFVGVAGHDVRAAGEHFADAVRVRRVDLDLDAGDGLSDLTGGCACLGDGEHRRGLGEAVALGELEAEASEEVLRLLRERSASGDEVLDVAAETLMHGAEEHLAEVEAGGLAEAAIERGAEVEDLLGDRPLVLHLAENAALEELPDGEERRPSR